MRFSKVNYFLCVLLGTMLLSCSPEDGTDGVPGLSNLTILNDEPIGVNCENGGVRIENGLDLNSNAILETSEVLTTTFLCDGFNSDYQDETRLVLFSNGSGASGTSSVEGRKMGEIIKFDKRNWSKLRSVVYTASIKSDNSNNSAIVELYDATNFRTISNSVLATRNTEYENVISNNLVESLPEEEINIYLRLRSENNTGDNVWISNKSELIIKQDN